MHDARFQSLAAFVDSRASERLMQTMPDVNKAPLQFNIDICPIAIAYIIYSPASVCLSVTSLTVAITGCAVAALRQHCCNDDQQSQWKNGNFDPL